ncbi:translation initiation factor IF-2 subunit gamma [Candidatus Woesearchaeota archaeon]|nr:translation initiation factor IF-2 subunit gamma [Candidatus Woesearchaeota archaeon]
MTIKKTKEITETIQPVVNIGLVGHVDHGKTSLLKCLSGKWADVHSEELKRGITIKLGYADVTFYKTKNNTYTVQQTSKDEKKLRTVSFVDAPGHETLMATMLSGSAIMDGALLLIAADEECPQPQTKEHLMALEILGIKNIVIAQNKIDAVNKEEVLKNYNQIKQFIKGTIAEDVPIIPISAKHDINISSLIEAIENYITTPERDSNKDPIMFVARSFDVNKPGIKIEKMIGGVLGGSIKQGILKIDDEIEIRPGRLIQEKGIEKWIPLKTKIKELVTCNQKVKEVSPGGSIALQTDLDPSIIKSDKLGGSVVGLVGKLPDTWGELKFKPNLLARVIGTKEEIKVDAIKKGEPLMLNVNAMTTAGVVVNLEKNKIHVKLKKPVCAEIGSKIAISRRLGNRWHLVGWALMQKN